MEYRSPVRLVSHASEPIAPYSAQAISRTRKKLLAEIALHGNEVTLDGIAYTRNDVVSILDGITDEMVWRHHCTIYASAALLTFLEKGLFVGSGFEEASYLRHDPRFCAFVSPYFGAAFLRASGNALRVDDFAGLRQMNGYTDFITDTDRHEAFARIRVHFEELLYTLRNLSWEKFQKDESVMQFLWDEDWIGFLNELPGDFDMTRDEIVTQVLAIVFRFQRRATWYYLHCVTVRLQRIETSLTNKGEVDRFEEALRKNLPADRGAPSSGSGTSSWRGGWWMIWVVLMFLRIGMKGCDSSSHYSGDVDFKSIAIESGELSRKLNESKNKAAFKEFLSDLTVESGVTKAKKIRNGDLPFPTFTLFPLEQGHAQVTIRNRTPYNALLFCFPNGNLYADGFTDRKPFVYAVFIKAGGSYSMQTEPDAIRLNLIWGRDWLALPEPAYFPVREYFNPDTQGSLPHRNSEGGAEVSTLPFTAFFRKVPGNDYYIRHDIILSTSPAYGQDNRILYGPPAADGATPGDQKATLTLETSGDSVVVRSAGSLFVSESK
ncbi:MAG: hypothetical protein JWP27_696 [Flaviaesturariibacter sp.]|nr:hypothetical protein [Flaviaesturariibacter sp.]